MAIYHLSGSVISRSQGRSAVACAAYRSAEMLHDERHGKDHDYTKKQDVVHKEILLPENAPEWMGNREKLWNAVEAHEKRKDAQLAREFTIALPRELTIEQNTALAREFVNNEFVSRGMVADLCIHNDKNAKGETQPHAHVLLTMREVAKDGFGAKERSWNAKENLLMWRESWAETVNKHLSLHGHDIQVDHRSLAEQGIQLEPQYKIGASVVQERLARFEDHQRIALENGERIMANPQIALDAITRQQSTFTHQDLARFINRHSASPEQFQAVYEKVKSCEQIVRLGVDDKKHERFTTKDMLATETKMLSQSQALAEKATHPVSDISQYTALASKSLTPEQRGAFEHLTSNQDLSCVVGFAGTGKSYLLGATREAWEAQGYSVLGATLSGVAAENLEGSSGIDSRTLASRCYYWDKGEQRLTNKDVLVIDEAGMIGSRTMARVVDEVSQAHAKLVLVGDPEQLQSIDAGAAFRAISEQTGFVELTDIRRQQESWQKEATRELATGETTQALARYAEHHHVHEYETTAAAQQGLIQNWNDARISEPEKNQIMLAYTRRDAQTLNSMARDERRKLGELGTDSSVMTAQGERKMAQQDRIYFLKNDRELGVMNGTLGTIEEIRDDRVSVRLDKDNQTSGPKDLVTINLKQYNHIDHGYAATIHKGQGVTVDRSYVLTSKHMDRHATYVATTRHRESADIFYSREEFANFKELSQNLSRERTKDVSADYTQQFAVTRGVERGAPVRGQERALQEAARAFDRMDQQRGKSSDDFAQFKAEFEAHHPGAAQASQDRLLSPAERKAKEVERNIGNFEKAMEQSSMPKVAREQLEKYATSVSKQAEVMDHLRHHNKELSEKIQEITKSLEISRQRDIGEREL